MHAHIYPGISPAVDFQPYHRYDQGQQAEEQGIMMPGFPDISVKQRMKHALAAASRALETGQLMEEATRHEACDFRIENEIYGSQNGCYRQDYYIWKALFHAKSERGT